MGQDIFKPRLRVARWQHKLSLETAVIRGPEACGRTKQIILAAQVST